MTTVQQSESVQELGDSGKLHNLSDISNPSEEKTLSKNQQKKLRRYEVKLKFRMEKRKLERERKKEKRKESIKAGLVLPPSRKLLRKTAKEPIDITIVVDGSFEEYMVENDIRKLVKQIQHCYAINRRTEQPFKYCVSSYGGKLKDVIEHLEGTSSWSVKWSEKSYDEEFDKQRLVYLSAESENVLSDLEEGKVYVIGGLVDHNSKKGLCHRLAVEKEISHAQLPISEYISMNCRKVLTVDHVFEILQKYYELKDWESAFFSVIPKRKGAQSKTDANFSDNDEEHGLKIGDSSKSESAMQDQDNVAHNHIDQEEDDSQHTAPPEQSVTLINDLSANQST